MVTRLSRYCDGLMEAAWLGAVLVVPVFFDVFSSRIFEPDKIALLRSLALVCLAAWLIKLTEQGGVRWDLWQKGAGWFRTGLRIPLIAPVAAVAIVYILATILSINPSVSFWGSYQRLQGTYTTFSYIVIFFVLIGNLRTRVQVERIITVIIVASLPVGLYGILQRYQLDPIPWGGDVTRRIASSMGNSIFVAAYLIMVFPLALSRIAEAFRAILKDGHSTTIHMARGTIYVFIAAIQVLAIYMSGSRGPVLGWMAGLFFFILVLTVILRRRWLTIAVTATALLLGAFLFLFNLEGGPLETLRASPAIGRFGLLLNAESNSALVRRYIWEGAADLVFPHKPLEFPDGHQDRLNVIRPLIGYGPESMFVAYSPFYVPELAEVERRNATPDRSHNETWDSVVITGLFGLAASYALYLASFYYGFKWMGLIASRRQKTLFFAFCAVGGTAGGVALSLWRGVEYIGLGLPVGLFLALLAYTAYESIFGQIHSSPRRDMDSMGMISMAALMAALLSHFIEINFGIAIVVTRLYFWVFIALLLLIGYILHNNGEYLSSPIDLTPIAPKITSDNRKKSAAWEGQKKKRRPEIGQEKIDRETRQDSKRWIVDGSAMGILLGILLASMGFGLISNPTGAGNPVQMILRSLTIIKGEIYSPGILVLFSFTWIIAAVIITLEISRPLWKTDKEFTKNLQFPFTAVFAMILVISIFLGALFWLWHASGLISIISQSAETIDQLLDQVSRYELIPWRYFIFIGLAILTAGWLLQPRGAIPIVISTWRGAIAAGLFVVIIPLAAGNTNLRIMQADIVFKIAEPFMRPGQWPVAISVYDRANQLAPAEDYYFLFKGKAYLEYARSLTNPDEREGLFREARLELLKAQKLNPLNTDHTANLARLYSLWASYTDDPGVKAERAAESERYFSRAVILSPKNARIWDERALVNLQLLNQPKTALAYLDEALKIDDRFDLTYALYADYYQQQAGRAAASAEKTLALKKSGENYQMALDHASENQTKFNYLIGLAGIQDQLGDLEQSIQAYEQALTIVPPTFSRWMIEQQLAQLYSKSDLPGRALDYAYQAISNAPEDQKAALQKFIDALNQKP